MPLRTWNTKADWDDAYQSTPHEGNDPLNPVRLGYERGALFTEVADGMFGTRWSNVSAHFNWPTTTTIAVVGCGFGWGIEALNSLGYANVWGDETSTYILLEMVTVDSRTGLPNSLVDGVILSNDLTGNAGRRQFQRDSVGQNVTFDVVATEQVLESLTDQEAIDFSADLNNLIGGRVLHIVTPLLTLQQDANYNWKTLDDWKTLIPGDSFASMTGEEFRD